MHLELDSIEALEQTIHALNTPGPLSHFLPLTPLVHWATSCPWHPWPTEPLPAPDTPGPLSHFLLLTPLTHWATSCPWHPCLTQPLSAPDTPGPLSHFLPLTPLAHWATSCSWHPWPTEPLPAPDTPGPLSHFLPLTPLAHWATRVLFCHIHSTSFCAACAYTTVVCSGWININQLSRQLPLCGTTKQAHRLHHDLPSGYTMISHQVTPWSPIGLHHDLPSGYTMISHHTHYLTYFCSNRCSPILYCLAPTRWRHPHQRQ